MPAIKHYWPRSRALKFDLIYFFFHPEQYFSLTKFFRFLENSSERTGPLFFRIGSTDMEYIIEYHVNATKYRWRSAAAPAPASGLHYLFVFLSSLFSVYLALFFFFPTKKQYIYRRYTPINNFEMLMPRWRHYTKNILKKQN